MTQLCFVGSYNAVDGIPSCANTWMLTTMLRETFQFNGYITGDCGAVDQVQNGHHYTNNPDDTCAVVLNAGTDIDCGGFLPGNTAQAIKDGKVSTALLDEHIGNLFMIHFRLGVFD